MRKPVAGAFGHGHLRALVTGLVLTLVAQASLRGALAPAREVLAGLWTIPGGASRDALTFLGGNQITALWLSAAGLVLAIAFAIFRKIETDRAIAALFVGLAVGLGWLVTYTIAQNSFEVVPIASITFTGPATDTLMGLVNAPELPLGFGIGLVPGVFLGAGGMALFSREFAIQRFGPEVPMERYLIGACLMGFGAMLAGGCAVGAGLSGGAVLSITAWLAVFAMWVSAIVTYRVLQKPASTSLAGSS